MDCFRTAAEPRCEPDILRNSATTAIEPMVKNKPSLETIAVHIPVTKNCLHHFCLRLIRKFPGAGDERS